MTVGSRINPNFPIPGVDQSSRGFRDNFSIIKNEIEDLQAKNIQLVGSLISDPIGIGNGRGDIVIPVSVNLDNVRAAGANLSVQYNNSNLITGSEIYYNAGRVGINTSLPIDALDVIGNAFIRSNSPLTQLGIGGNLLISASPSSTNIVINGSTAIGIDNANTRVGIGLYPQASTFEVMSPDVDAVKILSIANNTDAGIRFTTSQVNATLGLVLEQRNTNKVGGIRADQNGNISIHVNESMDASLSDASRVINILPNNNVGIGSMVPRHQLDVQGNAGVTGSLLLTGNLLISNSSTSSGIFFSDGSFQATAFSGLPGPPAFIDLTDVPSTYSGQANKVVTVNALENGLSFQPLPWSMTVACSDETSNITVGTSKVTFRMPYAINLTNVRASLSTASSSGNVEVDVNEGGVSIFSTRPTIDAGQKTSVTATNPAVLSDTALADDAEITVDIDSAGTGAKGLKVTLIGTIAP